MTTPSGQLLRKARKHAGFETLDDFADALAEHDIFYTTQAIGHWENGRRSPYSHPDDREMFIKIMRLLARYGGFSQPEMINDILRELDRPSLSPDEQTLIFPDPIQTSDWQIPFLAQYTTLIGRETEVSELTQTLTRNDGALISLVVGLGGIGKTALLQEALLGLRELGGYTALAWQTAKSVEWEGVGTIPRHRAPFNISGLLRHYLAQLSPGAAPTTPDDIKTALRQALQAHPCLLILDNLETLADAQDAVRGVRDVLEGTSSRAVLTSRERLTQLDGITQIVLKGLSRPASDALIRMEATSRGLNDLTRAPEATFAEIYAVTEGMPLALKLIVAEVDLGIALDTELERLRQTVEQEDLYRFIYEALWRKLSETAQVILVGAGTFAAPALRSILMQTCELDEPSFNRALPELVRASLLDPLGNLSAAAQRYAIHAMTRWFVNGPLAEAWGGQNTTTDL